jgi:hypothetical protein
MNPQMFNPQRFNPLRFNPQRLNPQIAQITQIYKRSDPSAALAGAAPA